MNGSMLDGDDQVGDEKGYVTGGIVRALIVKGNERFNHEKKVASCILTWMVVTYLQCCWIRIDE